MDLYKKLKVNKKKAKPGDLLEAAHEWGKHKHYKHRKHRKAHSAEAMKGLREFVNEEATEKKRAKRHKEHEDIREKRCMKCGKKHKGMCAKKHMKHRKGSESVGESSHRGAQRGKHRKNWIANAIGKPGALHRQLGIKQGRKIPASTLARAASKGGKLGRRARLAQTLKGFH